ncbi:flagellar export chaperone FlgN [Agromyces sp. G08B096]|uniref:Flagellar export chaperone FlgN n=1 Tax=Agromyces sp. G08B096 TaxID=3156399 RepID=A0AAU7W7C2_9MICO
MGLHELSAVLWRERELLDVLLYKLDVERLLLATDRHRWLGRAAHEIAYVTDRLKEVGLARAVESGEAAEELGVGADATLRELAEATEDPVWRDILEAHLAALRDVTAEIAALRDANELLLRRTATTAPPGGRPAGHDTYDASGRTRVAHAATLVDEET